MQSSGTLRATHLTRGRSAQPHGGPDLLLPVHDAVVCDAAHLHIFPELLRVNVDVHGTENYGSRIDAPRGLFRSEHDVFAQYGMVVHGFLQKQMQPLDTNTRQRPCTNDHHAKMAVSSNRFSGMFSSDNHCPCIPAMGPNAPGCRSTLGLFLAERTRFVDCPCARGTTSPRI